MKGSYSKQINKLASLTIMRDGKKLAVLPHPIDIYFKMSSKLPTVHTLTVTLSPSSSIIKEKNLNALIATYKINLGGARGSGKIFVKFHNLTSESNFKILVTKNVKPDYNTMVLNSKEISYNYGEYRETLSNQTTHDVYYLAVLPSLHCNCCSSFNFEITYFQCLSNQDDRWTDEGCQVGAETNGSILHCQCWHLSLFGGGGLIPPRQLDPISDIHLLMEVKDNPRTIVLVSSLIILYLIILVWTRHSDAKDELQRFVVILEDNFPGEKWSYLVTVFTGYWIGAGTDANVGLQLYGTKGMSRVHILQSHLRKVLKSNCDDWFLLFTPKNLGDIVKIHLFHDHSGQSPDWYCSKIFVYDLKTEKTYKFVIERWLSLKEVDECAEIFAYPISTIKKLKRRRILFDNISFGLRETHLLLSIITRHPRSSVTRSQRLSICLCIIMVHLLTNIMFYHLEEPKYPDYSFPKRQIIINMESTLLTSPFSFIIIFCFKKSRIISKPTMGENVPLTLTAKMAVPLESGLKVHQSQNPIRTPWSSETSLEKNNESNEDVQENEEVEEEEESDNCWQIFLYKVKLFLFRTILTKPLMPVQIADEDESSSQVRRKWMYAAWILCETSIFLGGLFIILYSLKMDTKLSNIWMIQSFRYLLANMFIMSPLKIITFALILAVLYGQLQYIPSYQFTTEAVLNMESVGKKDFLRKILKIRKKKCYHPLNNKDIMIIRRHGKNWRRWRIVFNFFVVILLYIILTYEVFYLWEGHYVSTLIHINSIFNEQHNSHKIINFPSFMDYITNVILPALNKKTWYNGENIELLGIWKPESGYTKDYTTRLMAFPRLRQQRVSKGSCIVIPMMENRFPSCNADLSWYNMDKSDYSMNWTPKKFIDQADDPWLFKESDGPLFICGEETNICYLPGGYTVTFNYNHSQSESTLRSLLHSGWLDDFTRVVILELVFYNTNTNLISFVTPVLEKLADGSFRFNIKAIVLHPLPTNYTARFIIILSFTFYYICRIVLLFNRRGLSYLFSRTGLLDIFLNLLMHFTMISIYFYHEARKYYLYNWHLNGEEDLRMFRDIFIHRTILRYETAILVIIIPVQVLHNFHFGKRNMIAFKIFLYYLKWSLGVSLVILTFYIFVFTQINMYSSWNYKFCTVHRVFGLMSYQNFDKSSSNNTCQSLYMILCYVVSIVVVLAIVPAIISYKEAKLQFKYCGDFNIFYFLYKKLRFYKKQLYFLGKKVSSLSVTRYRAGAENAYVTNEEIFITNKTCEELRVTCSDLDFKFDSVVKKLSDIENTL